MNKHPFSGVEFRGKCTLQPHAIAHFDFLYGLLESKVISECTAANLAHDSRYHFSQESWKVLSPITPSLLEYVSKQLHNGRSFMRVYRDSTGKRYVSACEYPKLRDE